MSPDETVVFIASLAIGGFAWIGWFWQLGMVARLASGLRDRWLLVLAPILAGGLLWLVLRRFASRDVREDGAYLAFYMAFGAAWVALLKPGLALFGLSARDDVIERNNRSAAWAIAGGVVGLALCFAGGNIGDGPGWWVVLFSAGLATGAFYFLWFAFAQFTGAAEAVTVERDPAAGIRVAGFFVAMGLILGRAVAGNWVSAEATLVDFGRAAWPALLVFGLAAPIEKGAMPKLERPSAETLVYGTLPALVYVLIAAGALLMQRGGT